MYSICTVLFHIYIPSSHSLKEKRSVIKPIIHRLHGEFNISVSEVEMMDVWNEAILVCAHVSNDKNFSQSYVQRIKAFIIKYFNKIDLVDTRIEIY
jgi:uncharacterized protein YlxP (DUF503 family)